jgi:hypothetical protein
VAVPYLLICLCLQKFGAIASATNAQRALHGRWFAARQIAADFQVGWVGLSQACVHDLHACMRGAACCRLSARPLLLPFTARFNWRLTDNLHLHCVAPPAAWLQFTPIYNQHFGL